MGHTKRDGLTNTGREEVPSKKLQYTDKRSEEMERQGQVCQPTLSDTRRLDRPWGREG